MPLRFNCHNCDARIRVPDGSEGRKVRCPRCGCLQHVQAKPEVKITVRSENVREMARGLEARAGGGAAGGGRLSVASATSVAEPAPLREFEDDVSSGSDNDDSAPWVVRDLETADAPPADALDGPAADAPPEVENRACAEEMSDLAHEAISIQLAEESSLEQSLSAPSAATNSQTGLEEPEPAVPVAAPVAPQPEVAEEPAAAPVANSVVVETPPQAPSQLPAEEPAPVLFAEEPALPPVMAISEPKVRSAVEAPLAVAAAIAAPPEGLPLSRPRIQSEVASAPAPAISAPPAPLPAAKPSRPLKPILPPLPQYASLLTVAWVLRFLAAMAVGGVLRVMDAHRQNFQGMALTFRDLIWGLIGVTLVWAAAEMVAAVRDLLIRGTAMHADPTAPRVPVEVAGIDLAARPCSSAFKLFLMSEHPPMGLIAGQGLLPVQTARGILAAGRSVACVGLWGQYRPELPGLCQHFRSVGLIQIGRWINNLRAWGCREAIMAGGVDKTRMYDPLRVFRYIPDLRAAKLWYRTLRHDRRTDALLRALAAEIESGGVSLIDSRPYMADSLATAGAMTRRQPTGQQLAAIAFARPLVQRLGELDIGQAMAVYEGEVLAIEAIEGTDALIERAGSLCKQGGWVLVKMAKPTQDVRFDLPTVGLKTIEQLKAARAGCLAIEAGKVILLDKPQVLAAADAAGIAIWGIF